jgi:hypothetical protein
MSKPKGASVDEAVERLLPLIRKEDMTLWEQGDELLELQLDDYTMAKVAQHVQRKVSRLRLREQVSREFPVVAKSHQVARETSIAWGVFRSLLNAPAEKRFAIFSSRPVQEWTVNAMDTAVQIARKESEEEKGKKRRIPASIIYKGGFRLGSVQVKGELHDDNVLTIRVLAPMASGEVTRHPHDGIVTLRLLDAEDSDGLS